MLWLRWVAANGLAEAVGLGLTLALDAAIVVALTVASGLFAALMGIALITATGAVEGTIVGLLQWSVLRRPFPAIARRDWVLATIAGALVAWFLGSLPSTLMDMRAQPGSASGPGQEPSPMLVYALAAGMGLVLGVVLAVPQWWVLRRVVRGAWWWIPANSLAWGVGLALVFVAIDLAQQAGTAPGITLVLGAGLFVVGATVGAVHGLALVRLASRRNHLPNPDSFSRV
jgi:hypothetical protein